MTEPLDWAKVAKGDLHRGDVQRNLLTWNRIQRSAGRQIQTRIIGEDYVYEAVAKEQYRVGEFPTLEQQIAQLRNRGADRPWRAASIREALAVPSIYRAVSLIANTTGQLSMKALKDEVELKPQERPRIIVRPNPKKTPRAFFRDTAWSLATYGEAWWYISHRDKDGNADSLVVVPAKEIRLDPNPNDRDRPILHWLPKPSGGDVWANEDFRQLTLDMLPGELRGVGPLQLCGAAISVAVESQEWAANFYAGGGYPSYWVKYAGDLSGSEDGWSTEEQTDDAITSEVQRFKQAWVNAPPNTPRVTDSSVEDIKQFDVNPQGAQMLEARNANKGDAANMYGIPGPLLSYSQPGSSLTYQNIGDLFLEFVRTCLQPNYLEEIDQTMSDLLTRSMVARMNTSPIEEADTKGRYETYKIGIDAGIIDAEYAQAKEGILPGDVENAPVPFSPPATITQIPMNRTSEVRCDGKHTRYIQGAPRIVECNAKLADVGPFVGKCRRCHKVYEAVA